MKSTYILGVRIDIVNKEETLKEIQQLAQSSKPSCVVTVNPEHLYDAHYDPAFKKILNKSNLNLCDGVGVKLVSFLFPPIIKEVVSGSSILKDTLISSRNNKYRVLVLVAPNSLATKEKIEKYLIEQLEMSKECIRVISTIEVVSNNIVKTIVTFRPNVTLLTYNHILANTLIQQMVDVSVSGVKMNVGGSFDYLLGLRKNPPSIFRHFGLEWLYRLVNEPVYRYKRVFKAVILFPLLVLSTKIFLTYPNTKE
ncbi:WecB/TagA/CpsF family glycosyltransferase [Candidatus Parcubacteria bacterium]|nr:WecB/TagA/CpsF family glycosyltransferase [Patescibacteria group bacterium]MCG2689379.1 WecB/TagA/CpsF family glycosyltransferase [Candidatus Parcubacteria bacterium]